MELQGSYQIAVVNAENKVDIRPVKVAERIDNLWVIDEGLRPGEQVVAEGIQKVRQGTTVNPVRFGPDPQSGAEQAPKAAGTPPTEPKTKKR
jgi:membrane fusion protein (multidrug efflux system)